MAETQMDDKQNLPFLYAYSMTSVAMVNEQSRMVSSGGYKEPMAKSFSETSDANFSAETKKISSGMVDAPAQMTPKATPGKMYELLPWPG